MAKIKQICESSDVIKKKKDLKNKNKIVKLKSGDSEKPIKVKKRGKNKDRSNAQKKKILEKKSVEISEDSESSAEEKDIESNASNIVIENVVRDRILQSAEKHQNRLYIKFRKGIEHTDFIAEELRSYHPDIISVSLPRKRTKLKFFHADFESKNAAIAAMKDLRKKGDLYVKLTANKPHIRDKIRRTVKKEKTKQSSKKFIRGIWK